MMKTVKSLAIVFCVGLCLLASSAPADEHDKLTKVTFSAPVQVGNAQLPAGTYIFKLMENGGDRNIVQIYNEDESHLITTIMAMPDYRLEPTGNTVVKFSETSDGSQAAGNLPESGIPIKEWFYPGDNFGQEFRVAPVQVAAVQPEPAVEPAPAPARTPEPPTAAVPPPVTGAPLTAEPPAQEVTPAPSSQTQQTAPAPEQPSAPAQLPQTASQMPLVGLIGIVSLAVAGSLRILLKISA